MIMMKKVTTHCRVVWKKFTANFFMVLGLNRSYQIRVSQDQVQVFQNLYLKSWPHFMCGKSKKIKLSSSPPVPLCLTSMLLNFLWPRSIWSISQTTLLLWEGKFLYFCQNILTRIVVLALCRYYFACLVKTWLVESWSGFWTLLNTYEKDF